MHPTPRTWALVLAIAAAAAMLALFAVKSRDITWRDTTSLKVNALATATATPPAQSPTPLRHRLAGVVIGDLLYAAVEAPDGTTDLYAPGDEVPGLGRVKDIGAGQATFDTPGGLVRLAVKPAPTPTAGPAPTAGFSSPGTPARRSLAAHTPER